MRYIIILMMLSMNVQAEDFNYYRLAANSAISADWLQTRQVVNNENYIEKNRFMGENPSMHTVNAYFITYIATINAVGENIGKNQNLFYGLVAAKHLHSVIKNKRIGFSIKF